MKMDFTQTDKILTEEENQWMSASDLMAGLMMVFLLVAIALMRTSLLERDKIKEIAVAFQEDQVAIYDALIEEFETDIERWGAEIDRETLTFTFNSPDVLFQNSEKRVSNRYKLLLKDFFPRYLSVLDRFKPSITEVRLEGHTSSVWTGSNNETEAYFSNMELSQHRTRSVLEYIYQIPLIENHQEWVKEHVAAVGFSSSKPVFNRDGFEDYERSRRVAFRVITNAEVKIKQILDI